jgi:hypothetical protein
MTTLTQTDADRVLSRIVNSLPGGTFELETFVGLVGIELTDKVPTAAVSCGPRSRLLINPDFVDEYCRTDEHLFLLVMHELWHVLLAHTRLYPRPTPAHNIAFDAIINAGLCRRFPGREYRGFFERLYPADEFPARLLRPPVGWRQRAEFDGPGPKGTTEVLTQLYQCSSDQTAHWADVLALLRDAEGEELVLLGNHDADDTDYGSVADGDQAGRALKEMVGNWPVGPLTAERPGQGGTPGSWLVERPDPRRVSKEFEAVLRRACRPHQDGERQERRSEAPLPVTSVLPSRHDRRRLARHRLGIESLLHDSRLDAPSRCPDRPATARVYLDVSGSMTEYVQDFLGPLTAYVSRRLASLWQFSTVVKPLPLGELRHGRLITTGGTDIVIVLVHALEDPATTSIVVVTDGYVQELPPWLVQRLRDRNVAVEVVLPSGVPDGPLAGIGTVTRLSPRQLGGAA